MSTSGQCVRLVTDERRDMDNFDLIDMLAAQGSTTRVLAASFRNTDQAHQLILAGIQAETLPPDVALAMISHPGTTIAVDEFSAAWRKAYGRDTLRA